MSAAACYGADPRLFDVTSPDLAEPALAYCSRCPVTKECEEWIRPKRSFYDGVCSGRVWHNGVHVKLTLF
jgi:WhiB family redox-sensing transcriptional regulator